MQLLIADSARRFGVIALQFGKVIGRQWKRPKFGERWISVFNAPPLCPMRTVSAALISSERPNSGGRFSHSY
jgi:hypothetical protein